MIKPTKGDDLKKPITFSPNLHVNDVHAAYWLRQVTIRLRREIHWFWHETGLIQSSDPLQSTALPPFNNKTIEVLTQTRNWEKKNNFFKTDPTMTYLTDQLQSPAPNHNDASSIRGSFGWVVETLGLDNTSAFVLALGLATTFDSAVGTVISACLNDPTKRHPTLALAQKLWDYPEQIMMLVDAAHPLNRYGLLRYSSHSARNYSEIDWDDKIEVPSVIAKQLLFPSVTIPQFLEQITVSGKEEGEGEEEGEDSVLTNTARIVASRLGSKTHKVLRVVSICGEKFSNYADIVRGIGKITNRNIVEFVGDPRLLEDNRYLNSLATLCWLRDIDLFLGKNVISFLTREKQQHVVDVNFLPFQSIPVTIFLGITEHSQLAGIPDNLLLPIVDVPGLSYYERAQYWKKALGDEEADRLNDIILESSRRFRYGKESINAISRGLKNLSTPLSEKDFVEACRAEIEVDLGDLAQRVMPRFKEEEDLILPPKQSLQFQEIVNAMKSLTKVHYGLGTAGAWNESGIFVLFSGPSGSGKTMAAEILAVKLDLPMYRIDLSQIVNKYIGETEKNLKRLFDAAEVSDILLFFDEADSIFGHRTEVKDAHDMYANQQVSYLLERIERFKGLAVLATNRKKDLDEAFARRIHYTIDFPFPGELERRRIWNQVIPRSVDSSEIDIDFLAKQFQLTGGHIRSIIFNACLQCASSPSTDNRKNLSNCKLTMEQVIVSVRREYEKLSRPISLEQFGRYGRMLKRMGYE